MEEKAKIHVFDPKVSESQIYADVNGLDKRSQKLNENHLKFEDNPYEAVVDSHAIAILTEWDEFADYDWKKIYNSMKKPAFVFDGRNILDKKEIEKIGFIYKGIGKS